jgi:LCP family protein required for cell wall assembly
MNPKRIITTLIILCCLLPVLSVNAQSSPDDPIQDSFGLRELGWDGESRLTAVILGLDRRPSEGSALTRTDTIIIVSIYPAEEQITLFHIPRDTFLKLPVQGRTSGEYAQANTVLMQGEEMQENYGPYWVGDVVACNFGVYVDRYVLLDFEAFIDLIDAMGGLEITTLFPISDSTFPDMNYRYDPFYLSAGEHVLNGYNALRYARTRHQDNDLVRGDRQIEVLEAIFDQIQQPDVLARLMTQAPDLLRSLRRHVETDIMLEDMPQIIQVALTIPRENIVSNTLESAYTIRTIQDGRNIVVPNPQNIHELMIELFGDNLDPYNLISADLCG